MNTEKQIEGLCNLGVFIKDFMQKNEEDYNENDLIFKKLLSKSEIENAWFTQESLKFALQQWASLLTETQIRDWLSSYKTAVSPKKVGLILAGNIPMVGFHDVLSVILSGHIPLIKLSSKDKRIIPFLLEKWNDFSGGNLSYELVEKLENYDAVIATGSNNTARYLEFYFKDKKSIIRKNRTSVAVLKGDETEQELKLLAEDIFRYFGLGCRNVTRLFIPQDFLLDRLFESFIDFGFVINHHSYANNYDYNKAIYLLNQEKFWDNNFVMLKEDDSLFSPLSVINFSRYSDLQEVDNYLKNNENNIQCVVAKPQLGLVSEQFGEAQNPKLNTYADNVDTMRFLEGI
ncbi:MAG: acyl-CoA reductase [Cruoricaptor ignavus]|nr:acyl-CoA reductase [Cruoricaptor ignavus]